MDNTKSTEQHRFGTYNGGDLDCQAKDYKQPKSAFTNLETTTDRLEKRAARLATLHPDRLHRLIEKARSLFIRKKPGLPLDQIEAIKKAAEVS